MHRQNHKPLIIRQKIFKQALKTSEREVSIGCSFKTPYWFTNKKPTHAKAQVGFHKYL